MVEIQKGDMKDLGGAGDLKQERDC
jgi:hypothetical protein